MNEQMIITKNKDSDSDKLRDAHVVVYAHGDENEYHEGFVIIPKNFEVAIPAKFGNSIHQGDVAEWKPFFRTVSDRKENALNAVFDDDAIFKSGQIVQSWTLYFNTSWNMSPYEEIGDSTGIFVTGPVRTTTVSVRYLSDSSKMNTLMDGHEERIIERNNLWDKKVSIGDVVKLVTDKIDNGTLIVVSCRPKKETKKPTFFTVKDYEKLFRQDFFALIENMQHEVSTKQLEHYKLDKITDSPLKKRVVLAELCEEIKSQIACNFTINPFEFYSFTQIHVTKIIPCECLMKEFRKKLVKLQNYLLGIKDIITKDFIITTCDQSSFLKKLSYLLESYRFDLASALKNSRTIKSYLVFDIVILSAEIIGQNAKEGSLSKSYYDAIMQNT